MRPVDPMRTRATDNGPVDGWSGARIGAERRDRVRRAAAHVPAEIDLGEPGRPLVTFTFLALALLATAVEFSTFGATPTTDELARAGGSSIGAIATGEWWKLLTANLLHGGIMHLGFNAVVLVVAGRWLEHLVGRRVVLATILMCLVTSTAGALLASPESVTIGASGVAFGLLGCSVAVDPRGRTAVGVMARPLVLVNAIFTFVLPGVSIGGHAGGLLGGVVVGALCWSRRSSEERPAGAVRTVPTAVVLLAAAAAVAALA
ncbi:MAG: Peptidase rhomboid domain protein, partial [Thermoleophilia bacterium]|nr:Peptidase rhomboid domain protein [Thermoleophilia bacterium]